MGTFPKKAANFSASIVADVTMSFRSERRATTYEKGSTEAPVGVGLQPQLVTTEKAEAKAGKAVH